MTAAVGHPTLRLVRVALGPLALGDLRPGQWRDATPWERQQIFSLLRKSVTMFGRLGVYPSPN